MSMTMRAPEKPVALPAAAAESTAAELIRRLLKQTPNTDAPASAAGEEILFDIDVDGARYLLVRMPVINPIRSQLSPREQEIVRMVAQGHANKIIADVLGISTWTVCTHLRRIFAKLGVGSRAAMVAKLMEHGVAGATGKARFRTAG